MSLSVYNQTRIHTRQFFRETEASEQALLLPLIKHLDLLLVSKAEHGASAQIVVHCEADPEARAESGGMPGEQAVR